MNETTIVIIAAITFISGLFVGVRMVYGRIHELQDTIFRRNAEIRFLKISVSAWETLVIIDYSNVIKMLGERVSKLEEDLKKEKAERGLQ